MRVTVTFQGIIADMLNRRSQQIELPAGATIDDLFATLTANDDRAQIILKQTRAFIDGKQADRAAPLIDGAEVIFMRPIAGGDRVAGCQNDPVTLSPYFDAADPGGKFSPPVCGRGSAPGA